MNMPNNDGINQKLLDALMKQLGPQDKKQLDALLADREKCEQILKSPEAQAIIKQFMGGK